MEEEEFCGRQLLANLDATLGGVGDPRQLEVLTAACRAVEQHLGQLAEATRKRRPSPTGGNDEAAAAAGGTGACDPSAAAAAVADDSAEHARGRLAHMLR